MPTRQTQARLEEAEKIISDPSFRQNKGLGNEVGYFIFDYPPQEEISVREWAKYRKSRNNPGTDGFTLALFDLYDLMISLLAQESSVEQCFEFENDYGFDGMAEIISDTLRLTEDENLIIKHICDNTPDDAVIILTGAGKCYPVIRMHKILNDLHQKLDRVPVVLLYPGKYDGQELVLFGSLDDGNYYRAFRLVGD